MARGRSGRRLYAGRPVAPTPEEKNRLVLEYLLERSCARCGYDNPLALDFHHASEDKVLAVSEMATKGPWTCDDVRAEIAKCEVVCRRCHRLETGEQQQALAMDLYDQLVRAREDGSQASLIEAWMHAKKGYRPSGCLDCDRARDAAKSRDTRCTECRRRQFKDWKRRRDERGAPLREPRRVDLDAGVAECTAPDHSGSRLLALGEFSLRRPSGRPQSWCRSCIRELNRSRAARAGETVYSATQEQRDRKRRFVFAHRAIGACTDCGHDDPRVLEFDHRGDKTAGVMTLANANASLKRIRAEIAKCDLRCGNCHRIRTAVAADQIRVRLLREMGLERFLVPGS